ncbi:nuclear transport factor 2 family protein [Chelatococcus sp. SYSU_G07232]|uniref:Nuclear transport factor 2 family protein n=1 Tax=Chelatococcus albus TaxID=3047466 RepID=A0ABT7AL63_9HYPH|nr:nuclear transport factor 2 family protein [Chelatococcus sp. SYSU_G07232]MDJ1160115.1 nuclear transport factor 2 family protein [Chelatococcus sp. SYSU_G07232]
MTALDNLADRYIAAWNETDAARRRELIAGIWTEGARYRDPLMQGEGPSGIDALIAGVQERFPNHHFRRTSPVEAVADHIRFSWELAPADGPALVKGTDFAIVADGRLQAVTGFLDEAPASPSDQ